MPFTDTNLITLPSEVKISAMKCLFKRSVSWA